MSPLSLYERIGGSRKLDILLTNFYATVREHPELGSIFNRHVRDWPAHLRTVREFWALQTGAPSAYPGGMAGRHLNLGLQPHHFDLWLQQWEQSCRLHFDEREADELIAIARQFGARLKRVLASQPGLQIERGAGDGCGGQA